MPKISLIRLQEDENTIDKIALASLTRLTLVSHLQLLR